MYNINQKCNFVIKFNLIMSFKNLEFVEDIPKLVIDKKEYYGINILEKLFELRNNPDLDRYHKWLVDTAYISASKFSNSTKLPKLGYVIEDKQALAPCKSIDNVGYDLHIIKIDEELTKKSSSDIIVYDTGVSFKIPLGYYLQLHPRSSIIKSGYMLANSTGIIDPSYSGTIKVPLIKMDKLKKDIELPSRVVQLVLTPYCNCEIDEELDHHSTSRGINGFGSSG